MSSTISFHPSQGFRQARAKVEVSAKPCDTSFQADNTKGQARQRLAFKFHLRPAKAVRILDNDT